MQARVEKAIDKGVRYLKRAQSEGSWMNARNKHTFGYVALMGLTLLECGAAPTDSAVGRAAGYVRSHAGAQEGTYELSLGILFLDRLGEAKDEDIIQSLAVRLLAGQSQTGGWGYKCPRMGPQTRQEILAALRQLDPQPAGGAVLRAREPGRADPAPKPAAAKPAPGGAAGPDDANGPRITARLKTLVVFQDPDLPPPLDKRKGEGGPVPGATDNSNTQFATLALWAAQRHGVPMTRTLARIHRRFETTQNAGGTWVYLFVPGNFIGGPAMTCVGLLGLAVGHGAARLPGSQAPAGKPAEDPRVVNGLVALSRLLDEPMDPGALDLYFLWSVERVGVLYNLPRIAEKD
jgi:hypothetical protein